MDVLRNDALHMRDTCLALSKSKVGKKADKLWQLYMLSADDREEKRESEELISLLAGKTFRNNLESRTPIFIPPTVEEAKGEFKIGSVLYNDKPQCEFGLRPDNLFQHTMIVGRSGAGKTNAGMMLLLEMHEKGTPWLLMDWKSTYRELASQIPDIRIYTIGDSAVAPFSINPLIPPACTAPKVWLKKLIEIMCHAYFLGDGSAYILQQAIDHIYQEFGVYDGTVTRNPTFRDVLRYLKQYRPKGRESLWHSSALRSVDTMCFGISDEIFNSEQSIDLDDLLKHHVVMELAALSHSDKKMFVDTILLHLHQHRINEPTREVLKHVLAIEECQHVLKKGSQSKDDTIIDIIIREIRETGQGLLFVGQMPSEISLTALANTFTTICLSMKTANDVNAMAGAMLLNPIQKEHLGRLPVGTAAIKLQGRITEPFLCQIPECKIRKGHLTNDMVRELMKPHMPDESDQETALAQDEFEMLRDIAIAPEASVRSRYDRLGLSARKGGDIIIRLKTLGMIRDADTKPGRIKKLSLTDKALVHLPAEGVTHNG